MVEESRDPHKEAKNRFNRKLITSYAGLLGLDVPVQTEEAWLCSASSAVHPSVVSRLL